MKKRDYLSPQMDTVKFALDVISTLGSGETAQTTVVDGKIFSYEGLDAGWLD